MRVIDAFCGTGGWSAGSVAAGCTPIMGIDCDDKPLRIWATNCPDGRAACAVIGVDAVEWPEAAPDVHVHLSPPCTSLSKARAGSAPAGTIAAALQTVRWCVQLVLDKGYESWSLENVATPAVVACLAELSRQHPTRVAYAVLDAADCAPVSAPPHALSRRLRHTPSRTRTRCRVSTGNPHARWRVRADGTPSNRARLIASTPAVIKALKEMPVNRVSVADAFAAAGLPLPAEFPKSNTTNRDGTPCVRSVRQRQCPCRERRACPFVPRARAW